MFLSFTSRLLVISNLMFQEIYAIQIQNPHNPKTSKPTPLYLYYFPGNAAVVKALVATEQNFMETSQAWHIILVKISIRVSEKGFVGLKWSH